MSLLPKIAVVVGTRPEIIKTFPVIEELRRRNVPHVLIHSNQHYSHELDKVFFEELRLPAPDFNLQVGSYSHAVQTSRILERMEEVLNQAGPSWIVVQGDTNTVLAAALCASKMGIRIAHVEAGLRSWDRSMPEEVNRILADQVSDLLFAVSTTQEQILIKEGVAGAKIRVVGNTIVDAIQATTLLRRESAILKTLAISPGAYFLVTLHRPSNVDEPEALAELMQAFSALYARHGLPLLWPVHPRTRARLAEHRIEVPACVRLIEPQGYRDFGRLMEDAKLILTDSGGIQEEACILGVPCLTLRQNTERPESIEVGANLLVGRDSEKILSGADHFLGQKRSWRNPFGDGRAAQRIVDALLEG